MGACLAGGLAGLSLVLTELGPHLPSWTPRPPETAIFLHQTKQQKPKTMARSHLCIICANPCMPQHHVGTTAELCPEQVSHREILSWGSTRHSPAGATAHRARRPVQGHAPGHTLSSGHGAERCRQLFTGAHTCVSTHRKGAGKTCYKNEQRDACVGH